MGRGTREADRLATNSTLAVGTRKSKRNLAFRGAAWGLGHGLARFAIGAAALAVVLGIDAMAETAGTAWENS